MDDRRDQHVNYWRLLGWIVAIIALVFVGRWIWRLDRHVWSNLKQLRWHWLLLSVLLLQLWFVGRFLAWEYLVKKFGSQATRTINARNWTLSELARYVPGNVWSFAARYRSSTSTGVSSPNAIQVLALEVIGLASGAGLIAAMTYQPQTWWWAALLIIMIVPIIAAPIVTWVTKKFNAGQAPPVGLTTMIGLICWYMIVWLIYGLATTAVVRSFPGLNFTWTSMVGINVAAWLIGYLSILTPMGLGVREISFVALSAGQLSAGVASLVSLTTRLWLVVSELFFLGLVLTWSMIKK